LSWENFKLLNNRAWLAQSVERETLNLKAAGSTPASGSIPYASESTRIPFFFFLSLSAFLINQYSSFGFSFPLRFFLSLMDWTDAKAEYFGSRLAPSTCRGNWIT